MKPAPFEYSKVRSVADAILQLQQADGEAKVIAGGQSLGAMMNLRMASPQMLIDINGIDELKHIGIGDDLLRVGAMVRHVDVAESPHVDEHFKLLRYAYTFVAHASVRNRGTLGGNICHADPASELPAVLQALDAKMKILGRGGERVVPANEFFTGIFETAVQPDELLVEIQIPLAAGAKNWGFCEASIRLGDFAYLAVAVTCDLSGGMARNVRAAYAGLADPSMRSAEVEALLEGQELTDELCERAGTIASQTLPVSGDLQVSEEHRKDLARSLTVRALAMARS